MSLVILLVVGLAALSFALAIRVWRLRGDLTLTQRLLRHERADRLNAERSLEESRKREKESRALATCMRRKSGLWRERFHDAIGICGVDEPMTTLDAAQRLKAERDEACEGESARAVERDEARKDRDSLRALLADALDVAGTYAAEHPKWRDFAGVEHDPDGAHALCERIASALSEREEPRG